MSPSLPSLPSLEDRVRSLLARKLLSEAVKEVVETYGPELRGYLRGTLHDEIEGDDVFQEVSIAILERLGEFRFESSLRTWCYAIAHNRLIKRLDQFVRRKFDRLSTGREAGLQAKSLSSLLEHQRQADAVTRAVAQLEPEEREIIIFRAEREMSFSEITAVLDLPSEASARKRFQRAKERLRELVAANEAEGEGLAPS